MTLGSSPPFNTNLFLHHQACQVKEGQAARAHLVVLVTQEQQAGREILEPQDQPAPQDTVTKTRVWGTTLEVNIIQLLSKNW